MFKKNLTNFYADCVYDGGRKKVYCKTCYQVMLEFGWMKWENAVGHTKSKQHQKNQQILRQKEQEQALLEAAMLRQDALPNVELPSVNTSAFIEDIEVLNANESLPAPDYRSLRYDLRGNEIMFSLGGFVPQRELEITNERMKRMAEEFENAVSIDLFAAAFDNLQISALDPNESTSQTSPPNVKDHQKKKEEQQGWEPYPNKTICPAMPKNLFSYLTIHY